MTSPVLSRNGRAALAYAERGWAVFPLIPAGKKPLSRLAPHGVHSATTDRETITRWWTQAPNANVAVAVPPGDVVLDVDGPEGWASIRGAGLDLPATLSATTGRGEGFTHLRYRLPDGVVARNAVGILPHVDTRAVGGYVVAPPSVTVGPYRWNGDGTPDLEAITPAPEWLVQAVTAVPDVEPIGTSSDEWARVIEGPIAEGERNAALARVAGLLFRRLPAVVACDLAELWAAARLAPPLPDAEVRRTVVSIATAELRRRGGEA